MRKISLVFICLFSITSLVQGQNDPSKKNADPKKPQLASMEANGTVVKVQAKPILASSSSQADSIRLIAPASRTPELSTTDKK